MASLGGSSSGSKDLTAKNQTTIQNAITRANATGASLGGLQASYGDTGKQDFKDQLLSKLSPLMNTADSVLNVAERPSQGILHALQQFSGTGVHALDPSTLEAAAKAFGKGITDVRGNDNLNLRGTLNQDPNAGGRLAGVFDTIGTSAIDPLTYVSAGTKTVGKVGLKIIEKELGEDAAKTVSRKGFSALSTEQQAAAKKAILESDQAATREARKAGGAQDLLDKITGKGFKAGALEDGAGVKFAGKTVIPAEALRPAAEALHLPQAAEALKGTAGAKLLADAFKPGAKIARVIGPKAGEELSAAVRQGRAAADKASTDVATQTRAAIKSSGSSLKDVKEGLTSALAPSDSNSLAARLAPISEAASKLTDGGKNLLHTVATNQRDAVIAAREAGVKDITQTNRVVNRATLKLINKEPTRIARAIGLDAHASTGAIVSHLQSALPGEDLHSADRRFAEMLGTKNVFKTNPLEAATDVTVKAHRDAATADMIKNISTISDHEGNPILIQAAEGPAGEQAAAKAKSLGYAEANTVLGKVYAPKELLGELEHAAVTLTDDEALKAFGGMIDKWGKLWRGYATVPALFGVGFHERNLVGNVFNMWLGGFRDVTLFRTADKIGRAIESGTNKGATIDQAIDSAKSLSPEDRHYTRLAYKEGVIGDSFFRTDQATTVKGSFKESSIGGKLDKTVGLEGPIIKSGTYVGRRIEDNSRLAMFIDQMRKHGDPSIAAGEVKKALFDYSELTPTEQKIKKVVPFYTYMRKNTPLQLHALVGSPGYASQQAHFRDNMEAGAPEIDGKPVPQYALQNSAIPLFGGKTPIVGSLATPFQAAFAQIQPLLELASQAPGTPKSIKSEGGSGKALREVLGNVGGGPLDLAKFGVEQATGKSLLTGSDLPSGSGGQRLAKALLPLYGKGDSTISDLSSGDSNVRNARLLSALAGISATALTDKAVGGETSRRARVLQGETKGLPTLSELRKSGKVPKAKKAKAPKKVTAKKTPTQKAAAKRTAAKAHKKTT